jgi:hypothetical protein
VGGLLRLRICHQDDSFAAHHATRVGCRRRAFDRAKKSVTMLSQEYFIR